MRVLLIFIGIIWYLSLSAQQSEILDSLTAAIETSNNDTLKIDALNDLARKLRRRNPDTAIVLSEQAIAIAEGAKYRKGKAKAYSTLRSVTWRRGNYEEALEYANICLEIYEDLKDKEGLAFTYNDLGLIHHNQSDNVLALEYFFKSLKLREELGNRQGMASAYNNIGIIYVEQSNHTRALDFYFKSLKIKEELANSPDSNKARAGLKSMAGSYITIGNVYMMQNDLGTALDYQYKARDILEELGNKRWLAMSFNNIGIICKKQEKYLLALDYYRKSMAIRVELDDKQGISGSLANIGMLFTALYELSSDGPPGSAHPALLDSALDYQDRALVIATELSDEYTRTHILYGIAEINFKQGDLNTAILYYQDALEVAEKIGALDPVSNAHQGLKQIFAINRDFKQALFHFKAYSALNDSLFNQDKSKEIGKMEAKHEFEKAEEEKRRIEEQARALSAEAELRRNNLQYSAILIFLVLLAAMVLILGKLPIPIWLAEGLVFFTFLIFFEFLLVLLDPYIEGYSGGEPAYKLLLNALLAGMIFPLHSFFESKIKGRIANL